MNNEKIKTVITEGQEPLPVEILEQSILEIATIAKKLMATRLKEDVIYKLISWKSGIGTTEVKRIIETIQQLDVTLLKPIKK